MLASAPPGSVHLEVTMLGWFSRGQNGLSPYIESGIVGEGQVNVSEEAVEAQVKKVCQ